MQSKIRSVGSRINHATRHLQHQLLNGQRPAVSADFRLGPGQLHFNPIRELVGTSAHAKYGAVNGSAISRSYHCGYQHHLVNRARANGRESRTVSEEGKAHLITAISLEMGDHNS